MTSYRPMQDKVNCPLSFLSSSSPRGSNPEELLDTTKVHNLRPRPLLRHQVRRSTSNLPLKLPNFSSCRKRSFLQESREKKQCLRTVDSLRSPPASCLTSPPLLQVLFSQPLPEFACSLLFQCPHHNDKLKHWCFSTVSKGVVGFRFQMFFHF